MAVRKLKNGKWRADWRDELGVRRRKDFLTKVEAQEHEADRKKEARAFRGGSDAPLLHPDITLVAWASKWFEKRALQGVDIGTIERQRSDMKHILGTKEKPSVLRNLRVKDVTRDRVEAFLLDLLRRKQPGKNGRPYALGTVGNVFHSLSAVLTGARAARIIREHPIRGLWGEFNIGKRRAKHKKKVKALKPAQSLLFMRTAKWYAPEHFHLFAVMRYAGLRPSEAIGLQEEKIDFVEKKILIDGQLNRHGWKPTKSNQDREVDVSNLLVAILQQKIIERKVTQLAGGADAQRNPWLFYPELGPKPTRDEIQARYQSCLRAFKRVLKKVGFATHYTLHSLRHTYATLLISKGYSAVYVQQQLGHESIELTIRTYGSWFPVVQRGAVDAIADDLPGIHVVRRRSAEISAENSGHEMDTEEAVEVESEG